MPLTATHFKQLARFQISKKLLADADVQSFDDTAARNALGINGHSNDNLSGIGFHYRSPVNNMSWGWRVRLDEETEEDAKYLMDYGNRHLFFTPNAKKLLSSEAPIVIVEAEKSALALQEFFERQSQEALILAIGGCAGWQRKRGKQLQPDGSTKAVTGPSPDLDLIAWANRKVYIALDSNAMSNRNVKRERKKLASELRKRGASILLAEIPAHPNVNGPDDLIAECGDEAAIEVFKEARPFTDADRIDLPSGIIYSETGKILPVLANAIAVLREEWSGVLGFNEFSLHIMTRKKTVFEKPGNENWNDVDDIRTSDWLQHRGVIVTPQTANSAVQALAHKNCFHPVREYLKLQKWDGVPRIETWLIAYLGATDSKFVRAVGKRWLISGVARIFEPGCQADHTLLLEGPQGIKKSTALRTLASAEWFTDHISDLDSKDSRMELHGVWIVELAELSAVRRSLAEKVKSFLSATADHFRPPYGRSTVSVPRQNIFAGSVNDETPFTDETGNRRFWPVRCGAIDIDKLTGNRDQLWAEAFECYENEEHWWLDSEELNAIAKEEQKLRYQTGAWDEIIKRWTDNPTQRFETREGARVYVTPWDGSNENEVTSDDVLLHAIGKPVDRWSQGDKIAISKCLTSNGWRRAVVKDVLGKSQRVFRRHEHE